MKQDLLTRTYLDLRERLRGSAARILGSGSAADDALQEAFYRLWRRRYPVKSSSEAEALLQTAVRHVAVSQWRHERKTGAFPENFRETVAEDSSGPEGKERMLLAVREAVEHRLNEVQRYIVRRKEFASVSLEEIARELEPAAVRMNLSRARKVILEIYQSYGEI